MEHLKPKVKFQQITWAGEPGKIYALDDGGKIWEYHKGQWLKIASPSHEQSIEKTGEYPVWPQNKEK